MYDLVVVGGGIAGLCAALAAPEGARIVVVDKGEAGSGSSPLAQGGMAAAVGPEDSVERHAADTIAAGAGLCEEDVVRAVCAAGPEAVTWLRGLGCDFDRGRDGSLDLAREGGQSVARSVHWRDATGAEIVRALRDAVRDRAVERVRDTATSLLLAEGRCVGVAAGERTWLARRVLLATGGAGSLWSATTNAQGATGDGIALAMRAGAQLADLEFMQFHPTALAARGGQRVLLTEALRGDGAILVDARGERFVDELAPRHVVAKAIVDAGGAFLDCRDVRDLESRFPTVVAGARARGLDPLTQPLPVEPAAHYFIGGVAADARGRTSIEGLYAAGECAATGMHGANRMAGNSLLETVVVGRRAGEGLLSDPAPATAPPPERPPAIRLPAAIPAAMWDGCGPIRDERSLRGARAAIDAAYAEEAASGDDTAFAHQPLLQAIVRAALARAETRGVHVRADHPDDDDAFAVRSFDAAPGAVTDWRRSRR